MPSRGWKQINFREDMISNVEKFINQPEVREKYRFESVPEFMRRAASNLWFKLKKNSL